MAEWLILCNNGSSATCSGSMGDCLAACEWFCGGPCYCASGCDTEAPE